MRTIHRCLRLAPVLVAAGLMAGCGANTAMRSGSQAVWADGIDAASFTGFALYSPGERFGGQELEVVSRNLNPPDPGGSGIWINQVNFIYGRCSPVPEVDEASCASLIVVQISPACDVNFSLYRRFPAPDGSIAISYEPVRVAGVPGIDVDEGDGGHRLEIYTGRVTIKIWDLVDQDRRFALAASLEPRNAAAREAGFRPGALPPPVEGALAGRLQCSAAEHS